MKKIGSQSLKHYAKRFGNKITRSCCEKSDL